MSLILAAALTQALLEVSKIIADKAVDYGVVTPLFQRIQAQRQARAQDAALTAAVTAALQQAGVVDAQGEAVDAFWRLRLDKLIVDKQGQLRRLVARHALLDVHPDQPPAETLRAALRWPPADLPALKTFLLALRQALAAHPDYAELLRYVDRQATQEQLAGIGRALTNFDRLIVATPQGEALRVQLVAGGLTADDYEQLEERYREAVADEYRRHSFRGIAQFRKNLRLPLEDIYVELGLTAWQEREPEKDEDAEATGEALAQQRLEKMNRRQREEDVLATAQRVVLLADPGAGKSMTLEYMALMLALGQWEMRLGFDAPYLPLLLPLRELAAEGKKSLSLYAYLLDYVARKYDFDARLKEFVRLALEGGHCAVLLDGLDEIGEVAEAGQLSRRQVVERVQKFADGYCTPQRRNRLIVTSRKEGYREAMLADVRHVELSALRPPQEIENFLLRFYLALEQEDDAQLPRATAEQRARARVAGLLPQILGEASVLLLATNPLLLTILVLIYENVGQLPNRRVKLYHICAQTLISSWRQTQKEKEKLLPADLDEETVFKVMARLAYWLHATRPGGTAPLAQWQAQLEAALRAEEAAGDRKAVAHAFLDFCRFEAGLLSERGLGRFGFFHLTFEEYLAGYAIAHTDDLAEQERMLQPHWEDPRWREVILLAAGELGILMNSKALTRMFLDTLLALIPTKPEQTGRTAALAGRALLDVGAAAVPAQTEKRIWQQLRVIMQAWDEERNRPQARPQLTPVIRHEAGLVLDSLGWLPPDLNTWVRCAGCGHDGGDLLAGKYPVTNAQFELFWQAGGYENPAYWGGEKSAAWRWRLSDHNVEWRGPGPVTQPEYWDTDTYGRQRRGFPVVGVSWYEAQAYCAWLTEWLTQARQSDGGAEAAPMALIADLLSAGAQAARLPTDAEWTRLAGGADKERYPWDAGRQVTSRDDRETLTARANVRESGIGRTSPVGMYPQGAGLPFGLCDLAGNVWEWLDSWYDNNEKTAKVLRGGSWNDDTNFARVSARRDRLPSSSFRNLGFRVVSPVVLAAGS